MIKWRSYITFQELSRVKILISTNARILKFCLAFKILALFACDLNIYTGPTLKLGQGLLIGTSVRRSGGRRSGVAVRAVDCWQ